MSTVIDVEFARLPSTIAFSYAGFDPALSEILRRQAQRIRDRVAGQTQAMIDTGRDLAEIKEKTEHGTFAAWVEMECGIAPRTAQLYMRAAEWAETNAKLISHLQPTSVLKLAGKSTPEDVVKTIEEKVDQGEQVPLKFVDNLLRVAREQKQEQERLAKEAAVPKRTREARRVRQERLDREMDERRRQREENEARAVAETDELATLLVENLDLTTLARVSAILLNTDVTREYYSSGIQENRLVDVINQKRANPRIGTTAQPSTKDAQKASFWEMWSLIDKDVRRGLVAELAASRDTQPFTPPAHIRTGAFA